jgi:hypothetical protein
MPPILVADSKFCLGLFEYISTDVYTSRVLLKNVPDQLYS